MAAPALAPAPAAAPMPDSPALALPPHPPSSEAAATPDPPALSTHSPSPSLTTAPSPAHSAAPPRHPSSSSSPGDNAGQSSTSNSSAHPSADPSPPACTSAAGSGPTNDDIEAVIQMAMASSNSPRATNPPRDTRTQLFVGNLPYRVRWQDLKDLFRRAGTVLRADVSLGPDNRSRGYGTVLLATAEDAGRAVDMFNGYTWQTRTLEVRPDRMGEELGAAPYPGVGVGVGMGPGVGIGVGVGGLGAASLGVGVGVGVFGTPLVASLSPTPASLSGAGSPATVGALASPAPTIPRFPGLSPFGASIPLSGEDEGGGGGGGGGSGSRPGTAPQASRNLFVGNLPFHIQWQDLKDLFRQAGAVQRADVALGADGRSRGFGTVSFANEADAERAVRMFNGYEYNGRPLKVHFDKFAAPSSSSAPLVGPGAGSTPHSPATFAFSHTHALSPPYGQQQQPQPGLSRTSSLAQQLLQQQLEHGRGATPASLLGSRRQSGQQLLPFGSAVDSAYDEGVEQDSLAQQLAQTLSLGSPVLANSSASALAQHQQQHQSQPQYARQHSQPPTHIPIPPAIQSPYTFDFLHSGPTTPYDVYDLGTYQRMSMGMGGVVEGYPDQAQQAYFQQQQQRQSLQQLQEAQQQQQQQRLESGGFGAPTLQSQDGSKPQNPSGSGPGSSSSSTSPPSIAPGQAQTSPPSQQQATSPTTSSRSHATPQQHPAHPGPIALPPPPPVTAFPIPPPHTLSPQYPSPHMQGHPMSPMHHPMMGMSMPMMTPHGLPPITPSMPSFSFLPQPSPGLPSPAAAAAAAEPDRPTMHAHIQHVMTPFAPFSPGVAMSPGMSPGAFWGRPGTGANPFINPAVGAPVRPGHAYYGAYAQQHPFQHAQQQQQQQPQPPQQQYGQQQQPGGQEQEQEGRPPDGYFPPVAVSMAMAQGGAVAREEPAGYFPWVPPAATHEQREMRASGLAHEILREDGATAKLKDSPGPSDGTAATTGTDKGTGTGLSSRGTSWHTDEEGAVAVEVEDEESDALAVVNGHGHGLVNGHGKPRAYSAETGASAGSGSGSSGTERGGLLRADSDPVRKALGEA
ncbi:hypothetical protein C8Q78DRAFT_996283 [Trametes maxima]|nr:hypothetical protein C8Q78DRAFT_996283 [Trametes maxima]